MLFIEQQVQPMFSSVNHQPSGTKCHCHFISQLYDVKAAFQQHFPHFAGNCVNYFVQQYRMEWHTCMLHSLHTQWIILTVFSMERALFVVAFKYILSHHFHIPFALFRVCARNKEMRDVGVIYKRLKMKVT